MYFNIYPPLSLHPGALSMALSLLSRKNAFEVNFFWERGDIPHIEKWKRKINSSSQSPTSN